MRHNPLSRTDPSGHEDVRQYVVPLGTLSDTPGWFHVNWSNHRGGGEFYGARALRADEHPNSCNDVYQGPIIVSREQAANVKRADRNVMAFDYFFVSGSALDPALADKHDLVGQVAIDRNGEWYVAHGEGFGAGASAAVGFGWVRAGTTAEEVLMGEGDSLSINKKIVAITVTRTPGDFMSGVEIGVGTPSPGVPGSVSHTTGERVANPLTQIADGIGGFFSPKPQPALAVHADNPNMLICPALRGGRGGGMMHFL